MESLFQSMELEHASTGFGPNPAASAVIPPRKVDYPQMGDGKIHDMPDMQPPGRTISNILASTRDPSTAKGPVVQASSANPLKRTALGTLYEDPKDDKSAPIVDQALLNLSETLDQKFHRLMNALQEAIKQDLLYFYGAPVKMTGKTDAELKTEREGIAIARSMNALQSCFGFCAMNQYRKTVVTTRLGTLYDIVKASVAGLEITYHIGVLQGYVNEWQMADRMAQMKQEQQQQQQQQLEKPKIILRNPATSYTGDSQPIGTLPHYIRSTLAVPDSSPLTYNPQTMRPAEFTPC